MTKFQEWMIFLTLIILSVTNISQNYKLNSLEVRVGNLTRGME